MNFVKFFFDKQEIKSSITQIRHRFSVPICISIVVTLLFFYLISDLNFLWIEEFTGKIILTVIFVFFLSIATTLLSESLQLTKNKQVLSQIWVLIFWTAFYYFFPQQIDSFESVVFFCLTLTGTISAIFIAPYLQYIWNWNYKEKSFYVFFYNISVVFFLTFIVGGSLTLLWNIAILTVTTLFDIWYSTGWDIHGYWTALALSFLTPCFGLTQIPKKWYFEETQFTENAFFHFLIRYIALPFIYIYFIILYTYTLKVLINFGDWPKWEVSWIVIWFSIFGYLIYIFSYIFERDNKKNTHKLTHIFRKYFPIVIIPQIWMLFYAISLRIWQYDVTINRYFVVVFGIWLLISSLYYILSQRKALLFLPALLTLFTLIISIGPWSVYNFPLSRQTQILKNNLIEAGILIAWEIKPLESYYDIDASLSGKIYSGIQYICNYDNCDKIKQLFPQQYQDLLIQREEEQKNGTGHYSYKLDTDYNIVYDEPSRWDIQSYITDTIKVQRYNSYVNPDSEKVISLYDQSGIYPMDIMGYDYAIQTDAYNNQIHKNKVSINQEELIMSIEIWELQENISLDDIVNNLREQYEPNPNNHFKDGENIVSFSWDIFEWKFIIESATLYTNADYIPKNQYTQQNLRGVVLLRLK